MDILHLRISLPRPRSHQIAELLEPSRFKISIRGRRWGKSIMGLIAAVDGHGPGHSRPGAVQGGNIWWIAPTYPISTIIWRLLKTALTYAWKDKSEVERRIELPTGGAVTIKSADNPDSLRGDGLHGVVFDEAAFLSADTWDVVRPALSDRHGWAWFISTPRGHNWLYNLYQEAANYPDWARWRGPTTTETVSQEELDAARAQLGSYAYSQEYLAEFVTPGGGLFKPQYFRYYTNSGGTFKLQGGSQEDLRVVECDSCRRFLTVDLAASLKTSADYTVVSAWAETPEKQLLCLDVRRSRLEGPDQVPLIRAMHETHRTAKINIENVGYQLALIQAAIRDGLPVRAIDVDKDKVSRAIPAAARMEAGQVYFPSDAPWLNDFRNELLSFPEGEHDDQVDTLSMAVAEIATRRVPKIRSLG